MMDINPDDVDPDRDTITHFECADNEDTALRRDNAKYSQRTKSSPHWRE